MNPSKPGAAPTALLKSLEEGKEVTVQQVRDNFGLNRRQAYNALARLEGRGFIRHVRTGTWLPTDAGLQAIEDGVEFGSGPNGPSNVIPRPKDTFRQRAWSSMRFRRRFTLGDLVADAGRGNEEREYENAMRYVRALRKAGIVGEIKQRLKGTAIGSNGFKQFILLKNLGPTAPIHSEKKNAIHDFNSGEDFPCDQV